MCDCGRGGRAISLTAGKGTQSTGLPEVLDHYHRMQKCAQGFFRIARSETINGILSGWELKQWQRATVQ